MTSNIFVVCCVGITSVTDVTSCPHQSHDHQSTNHDTRHGHVLWVTWKMVTQVAIVTDTKYVARALLPWLWNLKMHYLESFHPPWRIWLSSRIWHYLLRGLLTALSPAGIGNRYDLRLVSFIRWTALKRTSDCINFLFHQTWMTDQMLGQGCFSIWRWFSFLIIFF